MAAALLRFPRPALLTAILAALACLALIGRHPFGDTPGESPLVCMDGWSVEEMVRHLEARGLGLVALPTRRGGPLVRNAFLAVPGKTFEEVEGLIKDPAHIGQWTGMVYCEECPRLDARDLDLQWGGCSLRAGRFVFFGDRVLLRRIHEALLDSPPGPPHAKQGAALSPVAPALAFTGRRAGECGPGGSPGS